MAGTNDEIRVDLSEPSTSLESGDEITVPDDSEVSNFVPDVEVNHSESKHCWVCFMYEDDDVTAEWVKPCRCKGTAKWVHQGCLQRWIDEKQKSNSNMKVTCAQCKVEYLLIFPPSGHLVYIIELYDRFLSATSPFAAATIVIGSIYWSAVSYGAVTVMQICGQDEGKAAMELADPLMLLVGLPSIPLMLIIGKLIRWETQILKLWKNNYAKIPILSYLIGKPADNPRDSADKILFESDSFRDPISATRMFCGALLLPTVATFVGRCFFRSVDSNVKRALLGGISFVIVKGLARICLRQQQYIRQTKRKVINYNDLEEAEAIKLTTSPVEGEE